MQLGNRVPFDDLKGFCSRAFALAGMNGADSTLCADALVMADAMGYYSHGTANAFGYIAKARAGGVDFSAQPETLVELPAFVQIDAHNSLGMVASAFAMNIACDKAQCAGVGMASVKNSSHFGFAGYYPNIATKRGMVGIAISNVDPNMSIPGSLGKAIGNSPISIAVPSSSKSVFLDIATSSTAALRVLEAKRRNEELPEAWIIDGDGHPTRDPSAFPESGALRPMAGHKGYGLSFMAECLTGVLTGQGTSIEGAIPSWCFSLAEANNVSHAFFAIDVNQICGSEEYCKQIESLLESLHMVQMAPGQESPRAPGERAWECYDLSVREGIELPESTITALNALADELGMQRIVD